MSSSFFRGLVSIPRVQLGGLMKLGLSRIAFVTIFIYPDRIIT